MIDAAAVISWALFALAVQVLVLIEILGLTGAWRFHTVSYIASRNVFVAGLILVFLLALPLWWLWHVRQPIAT